MSRITLRTAFFALAFTVATGCSSLTGPDVAPAAAPATDAVATPVPGDYGHNLATENEEDDGPVDDQSSEEHGTAPIIGHNLTGED